MMLDKKAWFIPKVFTGVEVRAMYGSVISFTSNHSIHSIFPQVFEKADFMADFMA